MLLLLTSRSVDTLIHHVQGEVEWARKIDDIFFSQCTAPAQEEEISFLFIAYIELSYVVEEKLITFEFGTLCENIYKK